MHLNATSFALSTLQNFMGSFVGLLRNPAKIAIDYRVTPSTSQQCMQVDMTEFSIVPEIVLRSETNDTGSSASVSYECFNPFRDCDEYVRIFLMKHIDCTVLFRFESNTFLYLGGFFTGRFSVTARLQEELDLQEVSRLTPQSLARRLVNVIKEEGGVPLLHEIYLDHLDRASEEFRVEYPFDDIDFCRMCALQPA